MPALHTPEIEVSLTFSLRVICDRYDEWLVDFVNSHNLASMDMALGEYACIDAVDMVHDLRCGLLLVSSLLDRSTS